MSLTWSFAFGTETPTQLRDEMGFGVSSLTSILSDSAITYTYAGSPTRYSLRIQYYNYIILPLPVFSLQGWVSAAYYNTGAHLDGTYPIKVTAGNGKYIAVYMASAASNTFHLLVDNVFISAFTMSLNAWNVLALQYDMADVSGDWTGDVFLNGVSVASGLNYGGVQTTGNILLAGFSTGTQSTYLGQIILYDSLSDLGGDNQKFVTRCAPSADDAGQTSAGWVPTGGPPTNFGASGGDPLNLATYSLEATPVSGDAVVTSVDLSTALGITAGIVSACTGHTYSSGTAFQGQSHVGINGAAYSAGNIVSPVSTDQSYSYSTVTAALTGTSLIDCKYEIV